MSATKEKKWRDTLLLPKTHFGMKANLPQLERVLLAKWLKNQTYQKMRAQSQDKEKFILHDGPPYANGDIHLGTAMNKILKDIVNRSQQKLNKNVVYVPGWDCHGLPIEWKVEEAFRAKGKNKDDIAKHILRRACREFAEKWVKKQKAQFQRLGVWGEWDKPYLTMDKKSEMMIAREFLKFAQSGALYRGLKPVMWSAAEKTALAEAEIEYHDHSSQAIFTRFKVKGQDMSLLIWTTTPWTIPANRAIAWSKDLTYGLYQVKATAQNSLALKGEKLICANALCQSVKTKAGIEEWEKIEDINPQAMICRHPLEQLGYDFDVPLLIGDFVTDEAGTGFVHIAPSCGADDYELATAHNIKTTFLLDDDSRYMDDIPHFAGMRVMEENGKEGPANQAVISALSAQSALLAQENITHSYPHSWRSKTPVIFRATAQWFISMEHDDLRQKALAALDEIEFYPPLARNRLHSMVANRPDWVISRQRAWGVPLTIFVNHKGDILRDQKVNAKILKAIEENGCDIWFAQPSSSFLGDDYCDKEWQKIDDIVDVWFESGSSHAFVLENNPSLSWPANLYLEGSDQHRGWFQSSLLESCGTRGKAPFEKILTHGFLVDDKGRKMSKSGDNARSPNEFVEEKGCDILRLWVARSDYQQDLRWGEEAITSTIDAYRKLRNALRFLLGNLEGFSQKERVAFDDMPSLERFMLHLLAEKDKKINDFYRQFDFKNVTQTVLTFAVNDLSSFYFDIRKDCLYCDSPYWLKRRSCRTLLDLIFATMAKWISPILCFTAEEAWMARYGEEESVHLEIFNETPAQWLQPDLAQDWQKIRLLRKTISAALEIERKEKNIGSSLEAAPQIYIDDKDFYDIGMSVDMAEIAICSQIELIKAKPPQNAFILDESPFIGVVARRAQGQKCARSWKILPDIGADPAYPDLSPRDAKAVADFFSHKK